MGKIFGHSIDDAVMRRMTCRDPNQACRSLAINVRNSWRVGDLLSTTLLCVAAVDPEDVFCEIDSHCRNLHCGPSSL